MTAADDRTDYQRVLEEFGFTEAQVQTMTRDTRDQVFATNTDTELMPSPIAGIGLFATRAFGSNQVVMLARTKGKRTQAGRYVNHSKTPNARMMIGGTGDIALVTLWPIKAGEEITTNYRDNLRLQIVAVAEPVPRA